MGSGRKSNSLSVGFISTRFRGLDGVSLEAGKWASVLREFGHRCFWFAGELDRDERTSMLVPEAFFGHHAVQELNAALFSAQKRTRALTNELHRQKDVLKDRLYDFIEKFGIDLIIPENALSIPMNIPLGMAITELISETGMPAIAHHHDFSWERSRFLTNACQEILNMAFPPDLPSIKHVVINSAAQADLAARRSISAHLVYNVMDFDNKPFPPKETAAQFRARMGFGKDDIILLQPTRVVSRKGIEQAIYLVELLNEPSARLVVSHSLDDEGSQYAQWIKSWAEHQGVPLHFIYDPQTEGAGNDGAPESPFSLQDVYPHADMITYPSIYEGFGNAFLEAVYYRKPLMVNRYSVYIVDIEPKGFDVVGIDGYVTQKAVDEVSALLHNRARREQMVEKNWQLARTHFSYRILRRALANLLSAFFGIAPPQGLFKRIFGGE